MQGTKTRAKKHERRRKNKRMFEMTQYDEAKADSLDRLIRAALLAASEKLVISQKQSMTLLNRIKQEYNRKHLH